MALSQRAKPGEESLSMFCTIYDAAENSQRTPKQTRVEEPKISKPQQTSSQLADSRKYDQKETENSPRSTSSSVASVEAARVYRSGTPQPVERHQHKEQTVSSPQIENARISRSIDAENSRSPATVSSGSKGMDSMSHDNILFVTPPRQRSASKGLFENLDITKVQEFKPTPQPLQEAGNGDGNMPETNLPTFFLRYINGNKEWKRNMETKKSASVEGMRPMTPVSHNGNRPPSRASPGPLRNIWPPNVPYKYFADDIPYRRSCGGDENEPMIKVYVQSVADPEYVFVVEDEGQEYDKRMGELMVKIENAAASRYSQMLHFGHLPSVGAAVCAKVESPDIPGGEKIWLRALVLNRFVETEELLLFFIDLGETAVTPLAAVRSITPELMQIPKWINPVQITGRTNGNGPFDESAIEKARQLLVGKGHEKPVRLFVEDQLQDCIVGSMFLRLADKNESVLNLYRKNGIKF